MNTFSCDECRAIYQELRQAWPPGRPVAPEEIAAFVNGLDPQQCARTRLTSVMWKAWRRMQEHRVLTGHVVSLPGSSAALTNGN
jgi:hypothetical protein